MTLEGKPGVLAQGAISFSMSIQFSIIVAQEVRILGEDTKLDSSLMSMTIVGCAIFPAEIGHLVDGFDMQVAFAAVAAPPLCGSVWLSSDVHGCQVRH